LPSLQYLPCVHELYWKCGPHRPDVAGTSSRFAPSGQWSRQSAYAASRATAGIKEYCLPSASVASWHPTMHAFSSFQTVPASVLNHAAALPTEAAKVIIANFMLKEVVTTLREEESREGKRSNRRREWCEGGGEVLCRGTRRGTEFEGASTEEEGGNPHQGRSAPPYSEEVRPRALRTRRHGEDGYRHVRERCTRCGEFGHRYIYICLVRGGV